MTVYCFILHRNVGFKVIYYHNFGCSAIPVKCIYIFFNSIFLKMIVVTYLSVN